VLAALLMASAALTIVTFLLCDLHVTGCNFGCYDWHQPISRSSGAVEFTQYDRPSPGRAPYPDLVDGHRVAAYFVKAKSRER
jgi:hypothetical protein